MWLSEPFTKGQAWVDLFANANHKEGTFWVRGNAVKVQRGQIAWSKLTMSDRWGWSEGKVDRFLEYLKTEEQIRVQTSSKTTLITILNYELYQADSRTNRGADGEQTESRQGTNKNDKKEKKNTYPSQAQDSGEKRETLDPELHPPAKQKREPLPSVSDVLAMWNRYPDWKATGKTSAPVNQTAIKKLLPPAKITDDLTASIMKKRNKYNLAQIEEGIKAYIVEIANRPKNDYQSHRFSAYEFFTYPNGLTKYANR